MPGIALTRNDIDTEVGQSLKTLNIALKRVEDLRDGLSAYSDEELLALGYTQQSEVDTIRSALQDMDKLWKIYRGAIELPVAQDFRQFAKRLWGLGV